MLFRYQKAGELIRRIMASEAEREERLGELVTVISPESTFLAAEYAEKLVARLAEKGKTLFLPWDPFGGYGRKEDANRCLAGTEGRIKGENIQTAVLFLR